MILPGCGYVIASLCDAPLADTFKCDVVVDRFTARRNVRSVFTKKVYYGQLKHIVVIHLPATRELQLTEPTTLFLADVHLCKDNIDGPLDVRMYDDMASAPEIIDMNSVQCQVGRAKIVKAGKPVWAIIDRTSYLGGAIYADEEEGG